MGLLRFGDFTFDRVSRTLSQNGRALTVQPMALACIELFASHPGESFSPARLKQALWPHAHVGPDALRRLIREVRRTLGDCGESQQFVITRKGIGYEFRSDVQVLDSGEARPASVSWPFVGRESELESLRAALDPSTDLQPTTCLVLGEAGTGKTALIEEYDRRNRRNHALFCLGHCRQGTDIPGFWPFRQVSQQLLQNARARALVEAWLRSVPDLGLVFPELSSEPARRCAMPGERRTYELHLELVKLLVHISTLVPLLVVLEDLHFADEGSLRILEQLMLIERTRSFGLLFTCRPSESARSKCLDRLLLEQLGATAPLLVVVPQPLTVQEIALLPAAMGALTSPTAQTVHQLSGGNALFVRQLLSQLERSQDDLVPASGALQQVILHRLGALPPSCQELLEVAAVLGDALDLALIEAVLGAPCARSDVQTALDTGFLRRGSLDANLHFEHTLIREALYASLGDARRSDLHWSAVHALAALTDGLDHSDALATHAFLGGAERDRERAQSYLEDAAEQAFERSTFDLAATHWERALALLTADAQPGRRALLTFKWARARWFADEPYRAVKEAFHTAAQLAREAGDVELFARCAVGMVTGGGSTINLGPNPRDIRPLRLLVEAFDRYENADALRYEVLHTLSMVHFGFGNYEESDRVFRLAAELTPQQQAPLYNLLRDTHRQAFDSVWAGADPSSKGTIGAQRIDQRLDAPLRAECALITASQGLAIGDRPMFERGVGALELALQAWTKGPRSGRMGQRYRNFCWCRLAFKVVRAVMDGDFPEAERWLADMHAGRAGASFSIEERDSYGPLVTMFPVLWYRGRASAIEALIEPHLVAFPEDTWLCNIFRALCALERGDRREAWQYYLPLRATGFRRPIAGGFASLRLEVVARLTTVVAALGSPEDADNLYTMFQITSVLCGSESNVGWGSMAACMAELSLRAGRPEQALRHFEHALIVNKRLQHRPELVRTHMGMARALIALDREGEAATHLTTARAEASSMGMAQSFVSLVLERSSTHRARSLA